LPRALAASPLTYQLGSESACLSLSSASTCFESASAANCCARAKSALAALSLELVCCASASAVQRQTSKTIWIETNVFVIRDVAWQRDCGSQKILQELWPF